MGHRTWISSTVFLAENLVVALLGAVGSAGAPFGPLPLTVLCTLSFVAMGCALQGGALFLASVLWQTKHFHNPIATWHRALSLLTPGTILAARNFKLLLLFYLRRAFDKINQQTWKHQHSCTARHYHLHHWGENGWEAWQPARTAVKSNSKWKGAFKHTFKSHQRPHHISIQVTSSRGSGPSDKTWDLCLLNSHRVWFHFKGSGTPPLPDLQHLSL